MGPGTMSQFGNMPMTNWDRARTGFGFPTTSSRLFDQMDRMMEDMMSDMVVDMPNMMRGNQLMGGMPQRQLMGGVGLTPPIECSQEDDGFHFHLEAPGMKTEDMNVSIDKGILTIKGERSSDGGRTTRSFEKWMRLPEDADVESDKARLPHVKIRPWSQ